MRIHVAVGIVMNAQGQVLVALRSDHQHQGGLWEFPGGKVEAGETVLQALHRELFEEVGIEVLAARELTQIYHEYPDKKVLLDVWEVSDFCGEAHGKEGQTVKWVLPEDLKYLQIPSANHPIVQKIIGSR